MTKSGAKAEIIFCLRMNDKRPYFSCDTVPLKFKIPPQSCETVTLAISCAFFNDRAQQCSGAATILVSSGSGSQFLLIYFCIRSLWLLHLEISKCLFF